MKRHPARMLLAAKPGRDHLIVALLASSGLRVAEAADLSVEDVGFHPSPYVYVRNGKGGKARTVPILEELTWLLRVQVRGRGRTEPVFRARGGQRMSEAAMREVVVRVAAKAGIEHRVTPHALRHTFATRSLTFSGDVLRVSKLLGHANISTTHRYVDHIGMHDLAQAVAPLP